jgi:hypothetical protein
VEGGAFKGMRRFHLEKGSGGGTRAGISGWIGSEKASPSNGALNPLSDRPYRRDPVSLRNCKIETLSIEMFQSLSLVFEIFLA